MSTSSKIPTSSSKGKSSSATPMSNTAPSTLAKTSKGTGPRSEEKDTSSNDSDSGSEDSGSSDSGPDDSGSKPGDSGSGPNASNPSDSWKAFDIELGVGERVQLKRVDRTVMTVRKAREEFVNKLHEKFGIEPSEIQRAITKITPYVPQRRINGPDGGLRPAWIHPDDYHLTMEEIFLKTKPLGFLLFEMNKTWNDSLTANVERQNDELKTQEHDLDVFKAQNKTLSDTVNHLVGETMADRAAKMRLHTTLEQAIARLKSSEENMNSVMTRLQSSEENNKVDRERFRLAEENNKVYRERFRLAEENNKADRERFRLAEENNKADRERFRLAEENNKADRERFRLAEENNKLDRERLRLAEERLKSSEERLRLTEERLQLAEETNKVDRERLEAKLKEDLENHRASTEEIQRSLDEALAAQAENIDDTNEFIANGCKEDTAAYYRIKIRHLLNLTQAKLAYCAGLSSPQPKAGGKADGDKAASFKWRKHCNSLKDEPGPNGETNTKVMQAATLIRGKCSEKDKAAIEALVNSGALDLLVDDSRIRSRFDFDAHPGPLRRDNADEYRIAVKSHVDAEHNEALGRHLTACLAFLLPEESSC